MHARNIPEQFAGFFRPHQVDLGEFQQLRQRLGQQAHALADRQHAEDHDPEFSARRGAVMEHRRHPRRIAVRNRHEGRLSEARRQSFEVLACRAAGHDQGDGVAFHQFEVAFAHADALGDGKDPVRRIEVRVVRRALGQSVAVAMLADAPEIDLDRRAERIIVMVDDHRGQAGIEAIQGMTDQRGDQHRADPVVPHDCLDHAPILGMRHCRRLDRRRESPESQRLHGLADVQHQAFAHGMAAGIRHQDQIDARLVSLAIIPNPARESTTEIMNHMQPGRRACATRLR